jgi:hypothetical protein
VYFVGVYGVATEYWFCVSKVLLLVSEGDGEGEGEGEGVVVAGGWVEEE